MDELPWINWKIAGYVLLLTVSIFAIALMARITGDCSKTEWREMDVIYKGTTSRRRYQVCVEHEKK